MTSGFPGGPEGFLAMLRSQPGAWSAAKADAFERLWAAFPDPEGPPEWALRQILRGQFDRRLPVEWKPLFVEAFHQWLGFKAEADHVRAAEGGSLRWWLTSLVPSLRRHGWGGSVTSPMALLLVALLACWGHVAAGALARSGARARSDRALREAWEAQVPLEVTEGQAIELMQEGSTDSLHRVAGSQSTAERQREHVVAEVARAEATLRDQARRAARSWWWPW